MNCLYNMPVVNMETYRSGHNGADSKSVWEQSHEGSNPSLSAKKSSKQAGLLDFLFLLLENKWSESTTFFADLNFNFQYSIDFQILPNQEEKVRFPLLVQK